MTDLEFEALRGRPAPRDHVRQAQMMLAAAGLTALGIVAVAAAILTHLL